MEQTCLIRAPEHDSELCIIKRCGCCAADLDNSFAYRVADVLEIDEAGQLWYQERDDHVVYACNICHKTELISQVWESPDEDFSSEIFTVQVAHIQRNWMETLLKGLHVTFI